MQELRSSNQIKNSHSGTEHRRRDILFLTVLVPISVACFVAFLITGRAIGNAERTIFLLAPLIVGGVWLAYEQLHDLVWWNMHPLCPTCRRSYPVSPRPTPGMICDCCGKPLYPLRTPQDYKVIVLITAITVIALPVFAFWASLVARIS